ncbi:MAG TPA: DUF2076 domain-containing protein [Pseudolabrys sp.]|nr:DUF2076 domain-containing protein [Pseudolabrys sp.]
MTPQERALIADLFERLSKLENAPRDTDAERAISEGLAKAPGAIYPLVQTVLVQDEALKRANARIQELEGGGQPQEQAGFLDTMRNSLFGGGSAAPRGSVPSVHPGATQPDPRWNAGAAPTQAPVAAPMGASFGQGGSFLGTAAAAAAGMIGGSLLLDGIRGMFGHHGNAFAAYDSGSPWSNADVSSASGSDLARDAGLNEIGRGGFGSADDQRAGLIDSDDTGDDGSFADNSDFGGSDDGGGGVDV